MSKEDHIDHHKRKGHHKGWGRKAEKVGVLSEGPVKEFQIERMTFEGLPDADVAHFTESVRTIVSQRGGTVLSAEVALNAGFLIAVRYTAEDEEGEWDGWGLGGSVPFLILNGPELTNAIEALIAYNYLLKDFIAMRGIDEPVGTIADFRSHDTLELLTYQALIKQYPLGAIINYIAWKLAPDNEEFVTDPYIRSRCIRSGYFG